MSYRLIERVNAYASAPVVPSVFYFTCLAGHLMYAQIKWIRARTIGEICVTISVASLSLSSLLIRLYMNVMVHATAACFSNFADLHSSWKHASP